MSGTRANRAAADGDPTGARGPFTLDRKSVV